MSQHKWTFNIPEGAKQLIIRFDGDFELRLNDIQWVFDQPNTIAATAALLPQQQPQTGKGLSDAKLPSDSNKGGLDGSES